MDSIYENSILLIGGMAIGKSTISELLSKSTSMPIVSTDAVRCEILESTKGYSFEKQLEIRNKDGFKGEMEYLKPYSNIAINRAIDELSCPSIVDIGAFFPNQINDEIIKKIKRFKKVIWLYSDNIREILKRRKINDEMVEIYIQTLNHSLYKSLSTYKINVNEKTPDEIINIIKDEILLL